MSLNPTCSRCGAEEDCDEYAAAWGATDKFLCRKCFGNDIAEEHEREFAHGRWMGNQCKGQEVWTHHSNLEDVIGIDGHVCVGIIDTLLIGYAGKMYYITEAQAEDLWKDIIYQEYGTNDPEAIRRIEGVQ